ncbi:MAG: hypothetical protein ACFB11_16325 [Paracoccaceae bacterium]
MKRFKNLLEICDSKTSQNRRLDMVKVLRLQDEATLRNGRFTVAKQELETTFARKRAQTEFRLRIWSSGFPDTCGKSQVFYIKGTKVNEIPENTAQTEVCNITHVAIEGICTRGLSTINVTEAILNTASCLAAAPIPVCSQSPVKIEDSTAA